MLSIAYGISSALSWGAADFIGGLASKRTSPYRVLFLAELAGLIPFLAAAILSGEPVPPAIDLLQATAASLIGLCGLVMLYHALAGGQMSIAAPVSALLAGLLPVAAGLFTLGFPSPTTFLGFGLALVAVWLIAQSQTGATWRVKLADLRLPLLSGVFFGLYYILMHQATLHSFFWPLTVARLAGFLAFAVYALIARQPAMPPPSLWGACVVNGMLDIGGNAFFVLAAQTGRMDVAAVLGALYPASTVLLAWIFLKERIAPMQRLGVASAFAAILLFTR